ncbi:hypothetical protein SLW70_03195 [Flavobacterium sp. NG2]|uniref:hypothetical protein n=1 Tax=Flavobacterium sp. NG2 TaxID=3097547 RepID=UPI002A809C98|nr:hypothetical protein [Flavobacterium sp. NG2]WPR72160.1 hypothetical protein SLW70_03195 [Flavobacterium sp. NG2]
MEEIAWNSVILFLLFVFPGIVFRRFYFVGEFSKQFYSSNWINTFYISLIPGLVIQVLSYVIFINLIYRKLNPQETQNFNNYKFLNTIYSKLKSDSLPKELFDIELICWILGYMSVVIFISFIIAQLCWKIVRTLDWDKKYSPLRFNNYWHYYLSGESLKFKDFRGILPNQKVLLTEADVLVDIGNEGTKLYKGFLRQHTICKNSGDLKAIYLTDVRRYRKDIPPNNIREVPGHIMIIPAEKILNINLTYITKEAKKINYITLISTILNLTILLFLMYNPSNIFLRNTTIFGGIIGRLWLFFAWLIISAIIDTFINSQNHANLKSVRISLIVFFLMILLVIYLFFYM